MNHEGHDRLSGTMFAGRIELYEWLPSTIDACRALADAGAPEGVVVLARAQSAGRGQRGNSWFSPEGGGLYLSALLRPPFGPQDLPILPLVVGVAACEALREEFGLSAWMKHPNDLLVPRDGTWWKIGGLLVDSAVQGDDRRHAIVSLGLNCANPAGGFPPEIADLATSLRELGVSATADDVADAFLARLAAWRRAMDEQPQRWMAHVRARHDALLREVAPGQAVDPAESWLR